MITPLRFASTQWFEALAARMKAEADQYRHLGAIDCTMVVKVDGPQRSELYEIVFESFGVKSIRQLERLEAAAPAHFVLEGPLPVWRDMIENIRANGRADHEHTLNYLTFPDDPMRVTGPDQLETDAFYRYNESLQRFFDGAASLPTSHAS
jgi:hypothetical protein